MYTYPYLCDYIRYLEQHIQKLKQSNQRLRKKTRKQLRIDRMEYKIHELHVKTLSGTMNLGLTAQADDAGMNEIFQQLTKTGNFNVAIGDQEKSHPGPSDTPYHHPIEDHAMGGEHAPHAPH